MTEYGKIYIIRNIINSKVYIGQTTVDIKVRFQNHLSAARCGKDYVIGRAIRKYGEDKFYIELLEECSIEELNTKEIWWINRFNSTNTKFGYNISIGGNVTRVNNNLKEHEILELFKQGIPAYMIAKKLHTEVAKVTRLLRHKDIKYGLALQKSSDEEIKEYIRLYELGYSAMSISKYLNRSKSTILRTLKRIGVKIRAKEETKNLERNLPTLS